jgi:serine/threonine-protein kinase
LAQEAHTVTQDGQRTRALVLGSVVAQRYRIQEILGSGGYATVYKAAQINLGDREVALKVLHPLTDFESESVTIERFLREAHLAARLNHPCVVTIHDAGFLDDNRPYIAMQLIQGHSLRDELDGRGPLHPARLLPMFVRCLGGLAQAHALGIIHRDLKPNNLLLTDVGTREEAIRIIDFGVARLKAEERALTGIHYRVGTTRYLAPEYLLHAMVSPAMDVYQMGLVLVELLTGRCPVVADDLPECLRVIRAGILDLPAPLMQCALGPVLARALALDPAERFPNAAAFQAALEGVEPRAVPDLRRLAGDPGAWPASGGTAALPLDGRGSAELLPHDAWAVGDVWDSGAWPAAQEPPPDPTRGLALPPQRAERAPSGAGLWLALGAAALLALGLVGLGVLWASWEDDAPKVSRVYNPARTLLDPPREEPAPALTPPKPRVEPPAPTPEVAAVDVELEVQPPDASVWEGERLLGKGRVILRFPASQRASRRVRVTANGHLPRELEVSPEGELFQQVALERRKDGRPSQVTPAPQDPPKPEGGPAAPPKEEPQGDDGFGIIE